MTLQDLNDDLNAPQNGQISFSKFIEKLKQEMSLEDQRYEQKELIAEGGYGKVFKGWDQKNRRYVALKVMEHSFRGLSQTTIREVGLLRSAGTHENLVNMLSTYFTPNATILVMEYCRCDLSTFIREQPVLSDGLIKSLMRGILTGVHHLHSTGIVHRDLKPRNILLSERLVPKVADFGLGKFTTFPVRPRAESYGTRWYRAPEVILNFKVTTTSVDMWSIGLIFVELKEKRPLFPGSDHINQLQLIFAALGTPNEVTWPNVIHNCTFQQLTLPFYATGSLSIRLPQFSPSELSILQKFLCYQPTHRISAKDALQLPYFSHLGN